MKKHANISHLTHPLGLGRHFFRYLVFSPRNRIKKKKFENFVCFSKFWIEWPPKPLKIGLVTKISLFYATELQNFEKNSFDQNRPKLTRALNYERF